MSCGCINHQIVLQRWAVYCSLCRTSGQNLTHWTQKPRSLGSCYNLLSLFFYVFCLLLDCLDCGKGDVILTPNATTIKEFEALKLSCMVSQPDSLVTFYVGTAPAGSVVLDNGACATDDTVDTTLYQLLCINQTLFELIIKNVTSTKNGETWSCEERPLRSSNCVTL